MVTFCCTGCAGVALCDDEELAREPWLPKAPSRLEVLATGIVAIWGWLDP
jgi:hypothetical protein